MASAETRLRQRAAVAMEREGWYVLTLHGSPFSGRGRSDLIACCAGHFVVVEVKTPKGSATPIQVEHLMRVRRAGGCAFVGREVHSIIIAIHAYLKGRRIYMADDNELDFSFLDDLLDAPPTAVAPPPEPAPEPEPAPQPPPEPMVSAFELLTSTGHNNVDLRDALPDPPDDEPASLETIYAAQRRIEELLRGLIEVIGTLRQESPVRRPRAPRAPKAEPTTQQAAASGAALDGPIPF